jgi:hypothetical protein
MDQHGSASLPRDGANYDGNQNLNISNPQLVENLEDVGAQLLEDANNDITSLPHQVQQGDASNDFLGFQEHLHNDRDVDQAVVSKDNREDAKPREQKVGSGEDVGDGLKEYEKYQLKTTNKWIKEGIYKGLISSEEDYSKECRLDQDLKAAVRAGALGEEESEVTIKYWVAQLFLAFKDVDGVRDKLGQKGKPAQAVQRFSSNYYPDIAIERACWRIVVSTSHETDRSIFH